MKSLRYSIAAIVLLLHWNFNRLAAQSVTLPPSGDNSRTIVKQYIGALSTVTINYSSPNVTGSNGEDRRGKIWGELVPYGFTDQGFGTSKAAPWRAGANENTKITFSHDVLVNGKPLKAGSYGFFIAPQQNGPWTVIFSNNSTSWGSFFYKQEEDALRVNAVPQEAPYHEYLSYEFPVREPDSVVCALYWENKMIPFSIRVPGITDLYLANLRNELRDANGFNWQGWQQAATYCVQNNVNLEEALVWAEAAISLPFVGEENFNTLQTKADVLTALGRREEAAQVMNKAIAHPTASALQVHMYGRQLITQGKKEEALKVYQVNAKNHPNQWPVNWGLARGYSAVGDYKSALKYAKLSLDQAPDQPNKDNVQKGIEKLQQNQDIN
jgi:tetratricopeptide (TPR) repeat protein